MACPVCGLAPLPFDRIDLALEKFAGSLARLEAAGHLTRRQRWEHQFVTAALAEFRWCARRVFPGSASRGSFS